MTTIDDVLATQNSDHVLYPPTIDGPSTVPTHPQSLTLDSTANDTLSVGLYNSTTSSTVYAYITGLAINNSNSLFLLESDGETAYFPANPTSNGSTLTQDCAILLGAPGTTRTVTIPYIAGGRIWFCMDSTLIFLLNSSTAGPGLVEPSVSNTADPNYHLSWDFCEFTYSSTEIYANISYVDFACLPIALTLTSTAGSTQHVSGMPANGLDTICSGLVAQNAVDGAGWDQLVITNNGSNLRALSPSNGIIFNPSLFATYWDDYISQVWSYYVTEPLSVDTQSSWGTITGLTSNDRTSLIFGSPTIGSFTKPSSTDIFGAASGAFAAQALNTAELLNIGARLDAAFNRSTLLVNAFQPEKEVVSTYYTNPTTNHYARIVHAANLDGRGYCFPYDDVTPDGGEDQSGFLSDGSPANFLVAVGGGNAYTKRDNHTETRNETSQMKKRSLSWDEERCEPKLIVVDDEKDLEKGELPHPKLLNEFASNTSTIESPTIVEKLFGSHLITLQSSSFYLHRIAPMVTIISRLLMSISSLSIRTIVSRVFLIIFLVLFYFLGLLPQGLVVSEGPH